MDMSVGGRSLFGGVMGWFAFGFGGWVPRLGVIGVVVVVFGIGSGRKVVSSLGVRPRSNMRRDAASRLTLVSGGR